MSDTVDAMPSLDERIRDRVHEVVRGELPIDDFELWFVGEVWESGAASDLVADVTHIITDKDLFEPNVLLDRLWAVVATVRIGEPWYSTGAAQTVAIAASTVGSVTITRHWEPAGT